MAGGLNLLKRVGQALLGGDSALSRSIKQAQEAIQSGQFDLAETLLQQAHASLPAGKASLSLAQAYRQLAQAYEEIDSARKSLPFWLKAVDQLEHASEGNARSQLVGTAIETAQRLIALPDLNHAEKLLRLASKHAELLGMVPEQAEISFLRGVCAAEAKQPAEAEPWYKLVFQLANQDQWRVQCKSTVLRSADHLLAYYRKTGNQQAAELLIEELMSLYRPLGDQLLVLHDLSSTATHDSLHDIGLTLGLRFAQDAEAALEHFPKNHELVYHYAASQVGLAQNYYRHQQNDAAACLHGRLGLQKARELLMQPGMEQYSEMKTTALQALALPLLRSGRYEEGRPLVEEMHQQIADQSGQNSLELAKFLWDASVVYKKLDPGLSLNLNQQALKIYESTLGKHKPELVNPLHTLSDRYASYGDLLAAEATSRRAVQILEEAYGNDHPSLLEQNLLSKHCYHLMDVKHWEKAELQARKCLALTYEHCPHDIQAIGSALTTLSSCMYQQKKYAEAGEFLRECQQLAESRCGRQSEDFLDIMMRQGVRYFASGDPAKAWECMEVVYPLAKELGKDQIFMLNLAFFQSLVQQRLGSSTKATHFDNKAYSILKTVYPPESMPVRYVATILDLIDAGDLAGVLHSMDIWLTRAEQLQDRISPEWQVKLIECRSRQASAYGQHEQAWQLVTDAAQKLIDNKSDEPLLQANLWERHGLRLFQLFLYEAAEQSLLHAGMLRQQFLPETASLTQDSLKRINAAKRK